MTALDWMEVYAEARVAFPPDVWLRTIDDERGGVEITAYRREFDPPLPEGYGPVADAGPYVACYPYADRGDFSPMSMRLHRAIVPSLSYVVRDGRHAAALAYIAARRWERDAAARLSTAR